MKKEALKRLCLTDLERLKATVIHLLHIRKIRMKPSGG